MKMNWSSTARTPRDLIAATHVPFFDATAVVHVGTTQ
jgi:hypothetical protein